MVQLFCGTGKTGQFSILCSDFTQNIGVKDLDSNAINQIKIKLFIV